MYDDPRAALTSIKGIRDEGTYSSRNSSKGALIPETFTIFKEIRSEIDVIKLRRQVLVENCLHKRSFETRRKIWNAIYHRYLSIVPNWVGRSLSISTSRGIASPEFVSLAYLHFSLRDRLIFDFITGPVWTNWKSQTTYVGRGDVLRFFEEGSKANPQVKKWSDTNQKKLAGNVLSSLRDFGVLRGSQKKYIQRPSIAAETVYHLLCILMAEGKEGRSIIEAPDWRLFLWDEHEISDALLDLSQKRWIEFEKVGKTTMLKILRLPEDLNAQ
jgi:hypothetical protein